MSNDNQQPSPSLRHKLKASLFCFTGTSIVHSNHEQLQTEDSRFKPQTPRTPKSPYSWLKKSVTNDEPELRGRTRAGMYRKSRRHRISQSADFSYDPSSYALNFEDDTSLFNVDDFPLRNFSSRLTGSSPPSPSPVAKCPEERGVRLPRPIMEELPIRNLSPRLQVSPPSPTVKCPDDQDVKVSNQIVGHS
ncbi:Interleukin-2 receptor subunit beta like [Quillaja saponaria]|uniref:Interleukin-2 receptor subunit beta like n=1 Tax=Quillaja saponaria TaxID=32244 RepID=A0AAD7LY36_QUISA|nr:Interleukin-2 receptor subunit beta like [Quillaja saponaria]